MKSSIDLKQELVLLLSKACEQHFQKIKLSRIYTDIAGYVIYSSSGCRNLGIALCTQEKFSELSSEKYFAVNWDCINDYSEMFDEVEEKIDEIYSVFYDGELADINLDSFNNDQLWSFISCFLTDVIVNVYSRLDRAGFFLNEAFSEKVMRGLQFGDPDEYSLPLVFNVSKHVNAPDIHSCLLAKFRE